MINLYRILGYIVTVVFFCFFLFWLVNNYKGQDVSFLYNPATIISILVAAILYSIIVPLSSLAWRLFLLTFNCDRPILLLMSILSFTQFAKYVPGNFMQFAGRAALSFKFGITASVFVYSVFLETVLALLACVIVVISLAVFFPIFSLEQLQISSNMISVVYMCVAFSVVVLMGMTFLPEKVIGRFFWEKWRWLRKLCRVAVIAIILYMLNYFIIGLGMWGVSLSMLGLSSLGYAEITLAFCVAWVVGLIAPGAPAGLGPREAVFLFLIQGQEQSSAVLALIIALRLVTVIGDVMCFLVGALLLRRQRG